LRFLVFTENTIIYVGISVPATVFLGLLAALLIESASHARAFYRAAFFVPVASTLLAMALWLWCRCSNAAAMRFM
jgi:multiple sugar transport system permease protein